ncbi:MAG TPA: dockerin type I domain-containing protein [Candidatus Bathyarchaeia archaeon]|nr:dockerin type I domain-containing protein [Candidatus Bathyarchaeia archaeon]
MTTRQGQLIRALLLVSLTLLGVSSLINLENAHAIGFAAPTRVSMGTTLSLDPKIRILDSSPPIGTALKVDSRIRFVDTNNNGHWDSGETVIYDANNDTLYNFGDSIIAGTPPAYSTPLKSDSHLKFVDTNLDNVWDQGEPVVYDANNNGLYDAGELVVGGLPVAPTSALKTDAKLKFFDTNGNGVWSLGKPVAYDVNNDGLYSASLDPKIKFVDTPPASTPNAPGTWASGKTVIYDADNSGTYTTGDIVISGTAPALGTNLSVDSKIRFVDSNRTGSWTSGDAVVYDANNDNIFETGEPVIANGAPAPQTQLANDPKIRYVDTNNNNHWVPGDSVTYDSNFNGSYSASIDPRLRFWDANSNGHWDPGETVIYDRNNNGIYIGPGSTHNLFVDRVIVGPAPPNGTIIAFDPIMRFVDTFLTGGWSTGETIIYESDNNNVYDAADVIVFGTAPAVGTLLREPVIAGPVPAIGTVLKTDPNLRYVDSDTNNVWDLGEAVVYDSNSNHVYDAGEPVVLGIPPLPGTLLSEPVIAGTQLTIGTVLKSDPKIKFVDLNGNGVWDQGEPVVYDSNSNGMYDQGESVIAGGIAGDGHWDPGETVAYDVNNDKIYETGETVIVGNAPRNATALVSDSLVKFADLNGNGLWDPGEIIAYDLNNSNVYDPGDPVIYGTTPSSVSVGSPSVALDPLGRVWLAWSEVPLGVVKNHIIYFKVWNGTAWTNKQQVSNDAGADNYDSVSPLANGTMMIVWSSNKTGHPNLYYRLYSDTIASPSPTTPAIQMTTTSLSDASPSVAVDRYGRIWVVWSRQTGVGCAPVCSSIYYKYFDGLAWSADFPVPGASNPALSQVTPSAIIAKDGSIRIVWSSNDTGATNLYSTSTDATIPALPSTGITSSSWTARQLLFADTNDDGSPSMVQARDGTLYVFFSVSTISGNNIDYTTFAPNATSWTGPLALTSATTDALPTAAQMSDQKLWIFFTRQNSTSGAIDLWKTTSDPIAGIHDVGITIVSVSTRLIRSGYPFNITVGVKNYGDFAESTAVTLKMNTTTFTKPLSLTPGSTQQVIFQPSLIWGRYVMNATLQSVPGESAINKGDNFLSMGIMRISPPGDVTGDGTVDILDASALAVSFDSMIGSPLYNPYADFDHDGHVDIVDASLLAFNFGKTVL